MKVTARYINAFNQHLYVARSCYRSIHNGHWLPSDLRGQRDQLFQLIRFFERHLSAFVRTSSPFTLTPEERAVKSDLKKAFAVVDGIACARKAWITERQVLFTCSCGRDFLLLPGDKVICRACQRSLAHVHHAISVTEPIGSSGPAKTALHAVCSIEGATR